MIDREMKGLYMGVATLRDKSAFFIITILVFIYLLPCHQSHKLQNWLNFMTLLQSFINTNLI